MSLPRTLAALPIASLLALVACGGTTAGDAAGDAAGDDSGSGKADTETVADSVADSGTSSGDTRAAADTRTGADGRGDDAPGDGSASTCPTPAPTVRTSCVGAATCAYEPACPDGAVKIRSASYACADGTWADTSGGPTCAETVDSGAPACPTTEPAAGGDCPWYAETCTYGDGSKCHSFRCSRIGWVGPTPDCIPGCPATLPTSGASCASPGLACVGYGDARTGCGSDAICTDAGWRIDPPTKTCPYPP